MCVCVYGAKHLSEAICVCRSYSGWKSVVFPWLPSEWNAENLTMCLFASRKKDPGQRRWDYLLNLRWSIKGSNPGKTRAHPKEKTPVIFERYVILSWKNFVLKQQVPKLLNRCLNWQLPWRICCLRLFCLSQGLIHEDCSFIRQFLNYSLQMCVILKFM